MPKVSIIVPNYNHAPFLEQRMESILSQAFRDYELILLDDGSTDGSLDIIRRYKNQFPRIRVFLNERNSGSPFKQWDFGVRQAGGDYIWIAESDDGAAANFLEEMVPILDNHDRVGLAFCGARIINDKGQPMASLSGHDSLRRTADYISPGKAEIESCLCASNTINNASGVIFRKTSYIKAGLADSGMRYCGDWFLYLRILLAADIGYKASPLNVLRFHAGSSCHRYYVDNRYLEEVMRIYQFVMHHLPVSPSSKKKIHDEISRHFCLALQRGCIPSKQVVRSMREMVPWFELCVLKFIRDVIMRKYVRGSRP